RPARLRPGPARVGAARARAGARGLGDRLRARAMAARAAPARDRRRRRARRASPRNVRVKQEVAPPPADRERLESERDFLLQSLDDLELEHESGGIDDESYAQLRDDYTARAAAVLRALRDGVDARPEPAPATSTRRRVVVIAAVVA